MGNWSLICYNERNYRKVRTGVVGHPVSEKGERGVSPSTASSGNAGLSPWAEHKRSEGVVERLNSPVVLSGVLREVEVRSWRKTVLVNQVISAGVARYSEPRCGWKLKVKSSKNLQPVTWNFQPNQGGTAETWPELVEGTLRPWVDEGIFLFRGVIARSVATKQSHVIREHELATPPWFRYVLCTLNQRWLATPP